MFATSFAVTESIDCGVTLSIDAGVTLAALPVVYVLEYVLPNRTLATTATAAMDSMLYRLFIDWNLFL
ncbi:Uncharacterised protein [uncultured archaeon]|nr:Uncharacterised protein [uncultured archaeon]